MGSRRVWSTAYNPEEGQVRRRLKESIALATFVNRGHNNSGDWNRSHMKGTQRSGGEAQMVERTTQEGCVWWTERVGPVTTGVRRERAVFLVQNLHKERIYSKGRRQSCRE